MIYPDEEKITYSYNLGGQLEKVHGYKCYGYDYVSKIGYDKFEQRTYLKYCYGAETFYTYDPQRRTMARTTTTMWTARASAYSKRRIDRRYSRNYFWSRGKNNWCWSKFFNFISVKTSNIQINSIGIKGNCQYGSRERTRLWHKSSFRIW